MGDIVVIEHVYPVTGYNKNAVTEKAKTAIQVVEPELYTDLTVTPARKKR